MIDTTTYEVDEKPLSVVYRGRDESLFSHIPPIGPRVAVDKNGQGYADKYVFCWHPVPIYNPEHKAWYLKEISKSKSPWTGVEK